ncbi:ATP-dependent zinc protease family protein [Portibacter lacus]|uniref:Retropepsin-like aspartic endopeptidase domain-containing protein n=1 Tax=Portibacter lacus TaxID=1099794 RepID=A0AA37SKR3_9BACT|nr:RimK/LysX family protein [Portibacter lacus]GLR15632.1 hypothetical protein GCM10007940_02470 [Portibacter lacus]
MKKKLTIGRKDKGDLPDLDLKNIDLKIDTGAYTSAIHCRKIAIKIVDGKEVLTFTLLDPSHNQYDEKEFSTDDFTEKRIKSSFGSSEKRYIIKTTIRLFAIRYKIELSLSERGEMRFPILIGRKFLMGRFIINPSKYDLSYKLKLSKRKKTE